MNTVYVLKWHEDREDGMLGIFTSIEAAKNSLAANQATSNAENEYTKSNWFLRPEFKCGNHIFPATWYRDIDEAHYLIIAPVELQS